MMQEHKYPVGQSVRLRSRTGMLPAGSDIFAVTRQIRLEDLPPLYGIANGEEVIRIVCEDEIETSNSGRRRVHALFVVRG